MQRATSTTSIISPFTASAILFRMYDHRLSRLCNLSRDRCRWCQPRWSTQCILPHHLHTNIAPFALLLLCFVNRYTGYDLYFGAVGGPTAMLRRLDSVVEDHDSNNEVYARSESLEGPEDTTQYVRNTKALFTAPGKAVSGLHLTANSHDATSRKLRRDTRF